MAFALPFGRKKTGSVFDASPAPKAPKVKPPKAAKARGKAGAGKLAAPPLELLLDATESRLLAFGVQWRAIATAGGRDEAEKMAKQQGATHYLYRGQQLGTGIVPDPAQVAGRKIYPAAAVAARHMVGHAVCLLRIDEGAYWIAVTANGAPTSRDVFLHAPDDAAALEHARQVIAQTFAGLPSPGAVYTNIEGSGIDGVKPFGLDDLFDALVSEASVLQPVPKGSAKVPKPILYATLALCGLVLVNKVWDYWTAARRAQQASGAQIAAVDPVAAWAQAVATWEAGRAAADGAGLLEARNQLMRLPVKWDGWTLSTARCTAGTPTAGAVAGHESSSRVWSCSAQYNREPAGAVNRELATLVPQGWSVTFTPLTGVTVGWTFAQPTRAFKLADLRKRDYFVVEVASRLQALIPALAGDVGFTFTPVTIPAPKKEDGTALDTPPHLQTIAGSSLMVRAPLRTVDALIDADIAADWQELTIAFDKQEPKGDTNASSVMATVRGELHAKD